MLVKKGETAERSSYRTLCTVSHSVSLRVLFVDYARVHVPTLNMYGRSFQWATLNEVSVKYKNTTSNREAVLFNRNKSRLFAPVRLLKNMMVQDGTRGHKLRTSWKEYLPTQYLIERLVQMILMLFQSFLYFMFLTSSFESLDFRSSDQLNSLWTIFGDFYW